MKFVTEYDLRILFQKSLDTSYHLLPDHRLTPGGKQFLTDRKITITEGVAAEDLQEPVLECGLALWKLKKKSLQAEFLKIGLDLLNTDQLLAKELFDLERVLSQIGLEGSDEVVIWVSCSGYRKENFKQAADDCFEITGFHAQTENGRPIILLHLLRCRVREFAAECPEINLYPIINRLSQLICQQFGGKICQKQK